MEDIVTLVRVTDIVCFIDRTARISKALYGRYQPTEDASIVPVVRDHISLRISSDCIP